FVDAISRDAQAAAQPRRAFYKRLCQRWLDRAYEQMPVLRRFTRSGHEALIERFRRLDREQMPATQARLRRLLAGRRPDLSSVAAPGSELATLRRELQKQRRHKPIRQLFREIPQLLGQLKPCMLMSPLSISQFLDPALPPFDLVIFDEASQIRTEDAIGAIMRGQSLIVVGDNRQLPPTSFFATDDEPDEDDDAAGEIYESILDAAGAAGLPTRLLRWHYRSRDETLITFSNQQFYNARLATFPNAHAAPNRGVRLEIPRRRARAREVADLFLRRGDSCNRGGRAVCRQQAQRLGHGERANSVVEPARHQAAVRHVVGGRVDHAHGAHAHQRLRLGLRAHANVDPHVVDLAGVLALVALQQVDRLLANHADQLAAFAEQADALAHQHLRVPAAHASKGQKAIVVDIRHGDADLVDVAGQQHARRAVLPFQHRKGITAHIRPDAVGKAAGVAAPQTRGGGLVAGGAGRGQQLPQEIEALAGERNGHWFAFLY
ncbi:hypothetical protein SE17_24665, partial [Kouleothrix aurantiaca]